jgi:hypothetical protein
MPIPIVIVWGSRDSLTPLGWTAQRCPRCQKVQPFEASHQSRAHHIYFIEVRKEEIGTILACDFCDSTYALKTSETPKIDAQWKRSNGLESLVRATSPNLLPLPPKSKPTDQELLALLESTDEKGKVLGKDISKPYGIGMVVSGLILGPLGAWLRSIDVLGNGLDAFGWGFLGVIVGGGLGGIVWAIIDGRRKARAMMLGSLRRAMVKHWLYATTLRDICARHPNRLGRVRRVLAALN